jgi:preprotein translocase subunit SecG
MSFQVILIIHVLLALSLIALILMQHGKGADAGAAFGAGASGSVFGARGANSFIYKLTAGIAVGFFSTSLILAYLATSETVSETKEPQSVMDRVLVDSVPAKLESLADVPIVDSKGDKSMVDIETDKPVTNSKTDTLKDETIIDFKTDDIPK